MPKATPTATTPPNRYEVELRRRRDVAEMARKAFAGHVITPQFVGADPPRVPFAGYSARLGSAGVSRGWWCGNPGTIIYGFYVLATPGYLNLRGDLGTLELCRCQDMIAWASSAIRDPHYLAEKTPQDFAAEEYAPELVAAWVHEQDDEWAQMTPEEKAESRRWKVWSEDVGDAPWRSGSLRKLLLDLASAGESRDEVFRLLHGTGYDTDPPDFETFTHSYLWRYEALKWFLDHLDV